MTCWCQNDNFTFFTTFSKRSSRTHALASDPVTWCPWTVTWLIAANPKSSINTIYHRNETLIKVLHHIFKFSFIAMNNLASYGLNWHTVQTYYTPIIWPNIPWSHLSPLFPAGHCGRQAPVTWSQVTPSGQEHFLSQPEPKKPDPHSTKTVNIDCIVSYIAIFLKRLSMQI